MKAGDPADPMAIEEARRKLEEYYHDRGFTSARVTLLEGDKPEDRRAIFLINEGTKLKVWNTAFIGNTIASDGRLRTQISTSRPFFYLFGGEYDRRKLDEDVEKLTAYYKGLGFFSARIGRELEFNEKQNWVTITFVIDEGPRFKLRNVSVIGNTKYTNDVLMADLKLKTGDYFNQAKMMADKTSFVDKYGSIGYVFADIKPDVRYLAEAAQLDLIYHINEGDRYRVGKINVVVKGEYPHTQLTTVLNRLSLKPGDIVDIREIRASERRLKASQLFEVTPNNAPKIVFSPPGQEPDEDDDAEKPKTKSDGGGRRGMGRGMGRGFGGGSGSGGDSDGDSGPTFRGQSPDSPSRDRDLTLTLDCGRYVGPKEEVKDDSLEQRGRALSEALAQGKLDRSRTILTQYSPSSGQVYPASEPAGQSFGNAPAPDQTYGAGQPQAPAPAYGQANPNQPPPSQAAPAQPAPAYGQQMWPSRAHSARSIRRTDPTCRARSSARIRPSATGHPTAPTPPACFRSRLPPKRR